MFIEKKSFLSFCQFIQKLSYYYKEHKLKTPLHYSFSRSLFITTNLLNFLRQNLKLFFSTFSKGETIENYNDIKEQVMKSFVKNIIDFPSNIKEFLQFVDDKKNFLKETLFNLIFNYPEIFFVDFFNIISDEDREYYKSLLQHVFDDDLIDEIIQIIEKVESNDHLFNEDKIQLPTEKIIDSIDVRVMNKIDSFFEQESTVDDFSIDLFGQFDGTEFKFFKSLYANNQEGGEEENSEIKIMDIKYYWLHFINFLVEAPLMQVYPDHLPSEKVTEEIFLNMIDDYLIKPNGSAEIKSSFDYFKTCFHNNKYESSEILSSKVCFDAKMNNLSSFLINPTLKTILQASVVLFLRRKLRKPSISHIKYIFTLLIMNFAPKPEDLPNVPSDSKTILKNKEKYKKEKDQYSQIMKKQEIFKDIFKDIFVCDIIHINYFKNLTFNDYLNYYPNLCKYDEIFKNVLPHISPYNHQLRKVSYAFQHFELFSDLVSKFYLIFEKNSNQGTKYKEIDDIIYEIFGICQYYFGADGSDDLYSFFHTFLILTNPPHLVSNICFAYEFVTDLRAYSPLLGIIWALIKSPEFSNYDFKDFITIWEPQ